VSTSTTLSPTRGTERDSGPQRGSGSDTRSDQAPSLFPFPKVSDSAPTAQGLRRPHLPVCTGKPGSEIGCRQRRLGSRTVPSNWDHLHSPLKFELFVAAVRVSLTLSPRASLALPVLRLTLLIKPQEARRIVVEDVALLRFGQEVGRLDGFDSDA
jgi:hypothetical protein